MLAAQHFCLETLFLVKIMKQGGVCNYQEILGNLVSKANISWETFENGDIQYGDLAAFGASFRLRDVQ